MVERLVYKKDPVTPAPIKRKLALSRFSQRDVPTVLPSLIFYLRPRTPPSWSPKVYVLPYTARPFTNSYHTSKRAISCIQIAPVIGTVYQK